MSLGVGDVIAVGSLLNRIAVEIQSYRDAPSHFQSVGIELRLFHRALARLLEVEPQDEEEKLWLDQVRLIAFPRWTTAICD